MYEWKMLTARKKRLCDHCGESILPGEVYWRNSNNPYVFCEGHSPFSNEVRRAQLLKRGRRREYIVGQAPKQGKIVLKPTAVRPPVDDGGALFCPRCGNPLCDTYDPRVILCHICGYNYATVEDAAPDYITLLPREEAEYRCVARSA